MSGPAVDPAPQPPATADDCRAAFDWDDDGDVDLTDFAAFQRQPVRIQSAGAWGGPVNAFEKHGNIGYIGSGQRLVVLDMTNLSDIVELGAVTLGSTVMDLKVRDGLAYVVTRSVMGSEGIRESGFHVVDVADPSDPVLIWSNEVISVFDRFRGVAIDGFYGDAAFLREENSGSGFEWVADLTDPRQPVLREAGVVFRHPVSGNSVGANQIVIQGNLAFVATKADVSSQFAIYDLATIQPGVWPMDPQVLGTATFFSGRNAYRVAVDGDWAFLAVKAHHAFDGPDQEELWALDVSDPSNPAKHGSFAFPFFSSCCRTIYDLAIEGGRLYAANGASSPGALSFWDQTLGLAVFDIATDPSQPALIGSHKTHASVRGVTAEGDTVYLRDRGEGLMVMDAADPADPARLGGYHSPAELGVMERDGDLLYVADAWNGLSILDVSDLSRPGLLGVYQTPERLGLGISGLALLDGHVHLAAGRAGLEVIDVSDPAAPVFRGAIRFPDASWQTEAIAVDALPGGPKVAYLSVVVPPGAFVFSIDVTNPASPTQLDPSPLGLSSVNTFVRSTSPGRFFVATGSFHALLLDGSAPSDLQVFQIAGQSSNQVTSLDFDPDKGVLYSAEVSSSLDDDRAISMIMLDDTTGVELNTVNLQGLGDVAAHPSGMVVLGQFSGGSVGSLALVDMTSSSAPRLLDGTDVGFSVLSSGSRLQTRLLAGEDGAIIVTSSSSALTPDQSAGLETFRLRLIAGD
jgi:hypothetical protein